MTAWQKEVIEVGSGEKVSLPNNVTSKDILTRIGAIDKKTGRITNGAIPLFAKHPEEIKTIIWRNGYGPNAKRDPVAGPSRGIQSAPGQRAQSGARVRGPERAQKALSLGTKSALSRGTKSGDVGFNNGEQIILYCKVPRSAVEIMTLFGRSDRTKFKKAVLNSLMSDMLLEYTIPDKPNSRLQKYRLTAKGRRLAASLAKKGHS